MRSRATAAPLAVLVAEPHADFAIFLGELLGDDGHDVVVVFTAEQARAELARRTFAVVLVAASRVGPLQGVTLVRELALARRPERVIVMTDFRAPDVEAEALAAGAAGCLTKPFAAEALVRALLAAAGDGARAARERGSTGG